jgi:NAD-dependent DNA ligase/DNA polymerase/3'-5' exonuclease PolX
MLKRGDKFRSKAYQTAQETIMSFQEDIVSLSQLKKLQLPGIGASILEKFNEYIETGTLQIIEDEKNNPINILGDIYGVGPKKANDLVLAGITNIQDLRERQNELLNETQKMGLFYYEQLKERIPRSEIEEYKKIFHKSSDNANFEIVGSYRRGAKSSGDIDVIITGGNSNVYKNMVNNLIKNKIIIEVLSRGEVKTLVIARLSDKHIARRVDFLFAPPNEYAFAILYFTGSKLFNTVMRQHSINRGYTFNEHGIYHLKNKKKEEIVDKDFFSEEDIFDFLNLQYKTPTERIDGRAVIEKTTQILQIIDNFKMNGYSVIKSLGEKELNNIIDFANEKYYNQTPVLTDNQFDIIKEYRDKTFNPSNKIGAEVEQNKVQLPYEMWSMDKIKPDTDALDKWRHSFKGPYVISCKLDGVSGLYSTEGSEPKLYTRGNGKVGQDVSHLIPFLNLPKQKNLVIRGEFIIEKNIFNQKYKTTFANPRNMVAGIINNKHINNAINDIHFVAYEVIVPQLTPFEQIKYLKTMNMRCVLCEYTNIILNSTLSNLLVEWRKTYIYEIDGIIISDDKNYPRISGNPLHSIAFKMILSDQIAEAKVVDVIWTPSKDGYLKPRVQIEPINIGGTTIEYATGFNASFIKSNKIGIGAVVVIRRSGDVIPTIDSVPVPAEEAKMPSVAYKWNETNIDIIIENIREDPTVLEKNITYFFKGIGVEYLSTGNVTKLINTGYNTIPKIINMSEQDYLKVDGFKDKMANKIYNGIQDKLTNVSILTLMASSNLFGRGFSEKKMELVLNEFPNIIISNETDEEKIQSVITIKGMATKSAEAFIYNINNFKDFLVKCGLEYKLYENQVKQQINKTHPLFNETVVLTGTRDKTITEFLTNVGAKQGSTITKNTVMVITKNKNEETVKLQNAKALKIPIYTIEEFHNMFIKN